MRSFSPARRRVVAAILLSTVAAPLTRDALAQGDAAAEEDPRRAEAKAHFLRGVEHTERGEWDAAVSEFLASRAVLPTSTNTYNAAVALRKAKRFDEAVDLYEALLREFPDIPASEKELARRELDQLRASVGAIEIAGGVPRARVVVDGRERGAYPLAAPIRVGAGSHTVRVSADGYLPFETRVDVVGAQTTRVEVSLVALTAAGRLSVTEQTGKVLDVVVDNAVVGKTPWEGALPPGEHTVLLRGEGGQGTQPVRPAVALDQLVTLNLLAEQLDATLRVSPVPETSEVALDGVVLGRGAWQGRLRPGAHELRVSAEGYLPFTRKLALKKDAAETVSATLERDPTFLAGPRPSFVAEIDSGMPLGVVFGGDVADACSGACSAGPPIGLHAAVRGIYQLGSGFGFGLDAGYLLAFRSTAGADAALTPRGRAPNAGTLDDALRLSGLTLGGSAQYRRGEEWPVTARLGGGVLLGSLRDARTGSFVNGTSERYTVDVSESAPATYLYVAPEVRIGRHVTKQIEIDLGVEVLMMAALTQPRWRDQTPVVTSNVARGDGLATFGERTTAGSFLVFVAPGLGARYTF